MVRVMRGGGGWQYRRDLIIMEAYDGIMFRLFVFQSLSPWSITVTIICLFSYVSFIIIICNIPM